MSEIGPAGADGAHLIVKGEPAGMTEPGSEGARKTSKPAVWATTIDVVASAERHNLMSVECMMKQDTKTTERV